MPPVNLKAEALYKAIWGASEPLRHFSKLLERVNPMWDQLTVARDMNWPSMDVQTPYGPGKLMPDEIKRLQPEFENLREALGAATQSHYQFNLDPIAQKHGFSTTHDANDWLFKHKLKTLHQLMYGDRYPDYNSINLDQIRRIRGEK